MILQKSVRDIIKKVAKKHGITEEEATNIWLSQWKLMREVLDEKKTGEEIDTLKFPKWGRYYCATHKVKRILNKRQTAKQKKLDVARLLTNALDRTDSSTNEGSSDQGREVSKD